MFLISLGQQIDVLTYKLPYVYVYMYVCMHVFFVFFLIQTSVCICTHAYIYMALLFSTFLRYISSYIDVRDYSRIHRESWPSMFSNPRSQTKLLWSVPTRNCALLDSRAIDGKILAQQIILFALYNICVVLKSI